jgi:hypothetical protein
MHSLAQAADCAGKLVAFFHAQFAGRHGLQDGARVGSTLDGRQLKLHEARFREGPGRDLAVTACPACALAAMVRALMAW